MERTEIKIGKYIRYLESGWDKKTGKLDRDGRTALREAWKQSDKIKNKSKMYKKPHH